MIFFARATRGRSLSSSGLMARVGVLWVVGEKVARSILTRSAL